MLVEEGERKMTIYRIKDWDKHYENNRTRTMDEMRWVPVPNKHDGDGYTEIVDGKNGAAILGGWLAVIQVASKCHPRGTLVRDNGQPHDPRSLSRLTRLPESVFVDVLKKASSPSVGWIEVLESEEVAGDCQAGVTETAGGCGSMTMEGNGMEGKGREKKGKEPPPIPASLDSAGFKQAWGMFVDHRKHKRTGLTDEAVRMAFKKLEAMGHDRAIAAIEHSVANGYTGIFEPDGSATRNGHLNQAQARRDQRRAGECPEDLSPESVPDI